MTLIDFLLCSSIDYHLPPIFYSLTKFRLSISMFGNNKHQSVICKWSEYFIFSWSFGEIIELNIGFEHEVVTGRIVFMYSNTRLMDMLLVHHPIFIC
jgi:hypothetical protein